jgi:type IV pilus assembly protein PilX
MKTDSSKVTSKNSKNSSSLRDGCVNEVSGKIPLHLPHSSQPCGLVASGAVAEKTGMRGVKTTLLVISAGIAEIQKPWMAMPDLANRFFCYVEFFLGCFSHPCVLDSGNPCRNDGEYDLCRSLYPAGEVGFRGFHKKQQNIRKQKGATLFIALIFLIMLSLLGASVAQMSGMEERMSGNTRSRDLAFQAAEAALKHVEQNLAATENIHTLIPAPADTTSGTVAGAGLRAINVCLPNNADYWNGTGAPDCAGTTRSYTWYSNETTETTTTARKPSHSLNQVAKQPLYVVERLPNVGTTEKYRATARGVGGDTASVVILQAMFSYTPP